MKRLGPTRSQRGDSTLAVVLATLAVVGVVALFFVERHLLTVGHIWLRGGMPFWSMIGAGLVAAAIYAVAIDTRVGSPSPAAIAGFTVMGVVAIVCGGWIAYRPYQSEQHYAKRMVRVEDDLPEYHERPAWRLAKNLLDNNSGELRGNKRNARYVIDGDDGGRWSMIVDGSGTGRPLNGVVEWSGKGNSSTDFEVCHFDAATRVKAMDGALWNNLRRTIHQTSGGAGLILESSDAYGTCTDGEATVYWPAKIRTGWFDTMDVFGGLVVIEGNGDIRVVHDIDEGDFPGPVYPQSLAAQQRRSIQASGTWGDWLFERRKVMLTADEPAGLAATESDGGEGGEDPNVGNTTEFMLQRIDGSPQYVTPLLQKDAGRNVLFASEIDAGHARRGQVNELRLHRITPRKSNTEVSQLVRASFPDLPYHSGLEIIEVVPEGELWTGVLGQPLVAMWRFTISTDGTVCLFDYKTGKRRGCASEDAPQEAPPSTGEVPEPDTEDPANGGGAEPDDISGLSDAELVELLNRVSGEMRNRLDAGG